MAYNLRPLSFAEILDRALRVLIDNAFVLLGISAIVFVPESLVSKLGPAFAIIAGISLIAAAPLFQAAITSAIAAIYLDRPVTIATAYRSGWSILLPFVGTSFLLYSPVIVIAVLWGVAFGVAKVMGGAAVVLLVLSFLIGIPLMLYLVTRWSLIGPIMIAENRFGLSALRRSSELVKGVWWRTFGLSLVAGLLLQIPLGALGLIWSSLPVLGPILSGVATSITTAYYAIAIVVYYFDRRCRVEDFDLRHLAEQIRAEGTASSQNSSGAPSIG
jgi:hypothetical protein